MPNRNSESEAPEQEEKINLDTLRKQFIDKVGNYELTDPQDKVTVLTTEEAHAKVAAILNNKDAVEALYTETQPSSRVSQEKLINYIFDNCNKIPVDPKALEMLNNNAANETVSTEQVMEALLGKEGVALYQDAFKEERESCEYRDADFLVSTDFHPGSKLKNPFVLWVAGPSASGKTYATSNMVKLIAEQLPKESAGVEQGNYVVTVDGANERKMSQMRQLVVQIALKKGFAGIEDLEDVGNKSAAGGGVKKYVERAAETAKLNIVIPETFAANKKKKLKKIKKYAKDSNRVQIFSKIVGRKNEKGEKSAEDKRRFKNTVTIQGISRAFSPVKWIGTIKPNNRSIDVESKKYGGFFGFKVGFEAGKSASGDARKTYVKHQAKNNNPLLYIESTNDVIFVKPEEKEGEIVRWVECTDPKEDAKSVDLVRMPIDLYDLYKGMGEDDMRMSKKALEGWRDRQLKNPDRPSLNKITTNMPRQVSMNKIQDNIKNTLSKCGKGHDNILKSDILAKDNLQLALDDGELPTVLQGEATDKSVLAYITQAMHYHEKNTFLNPPQVCTRWTAGTGDKQITILHVDTDATLKMADSDKQRSKIICGHDLAVRQLSLLGGVIEMMQYGLAGINDEQARKVIIKNLYEKFAKDISSDPISPNKTQEKMKEFRKRLAAELAILTGQSEEQLAIAVSKAEPEFIEKYNANKVLMFTTKDQHNNKVGYRTAVEIPAGCSLTEAQKEEFQKIHGEGGKPAWFNKESKAKQDKLLQEIPKAGESWDAYSGKFKSAMMVDRPGIHNMRRRYDFYNDALVSSDCLTGVPVPYEAPEIEWEGLAEQNVAQVKEFVIKSRGEGRPPPTMIYSQTLLKEWTDETKYLAVQNNAVQTVEADAESPPLLFGHDPVDEARITRRFNPMPGQRASWWSGTDAVIEKVNNIISCDDDTLVEKLGITSEQSELRRAMIEETIKQLKQLKKEGPKSGKNYLMEKVVLTTRLVKLAGGEVVFNCKSGKDRTGALGFISAVHETYYAIYGNYPSINDASDSVERKNYVKLAVSMFRDNIIQASAANNAPGSHGIVDQKHIRRLATSGIFDEDIARALGEDLKRSAKLAKLNKDDSSKATEVLVTDPTPPLPHNAYYEARICQKKDAQKALGSVDATLRVDTVSNASVAAQAAALSDEEKAIVSTYHLDRHIQPARGMGFARQVHTCVAQSVDTMEKGSLRREVAFSKDKNFPAKLKPVELCQVAVIVVETMLRNTTQTNPHMDIEPGADPRFAYALQLAAQAAGVNCTLPADVINNNAVEVRDLKDAFDMARNSKEVEKALGSKPSQRIPALKESSTPSLSAGG